MSMGSDNFLDLRCHVGFYNGVYNVHAGYTTIIQEYIYAFLVTFKPLDLSGIYFNYIGHNMSISSHKDFEILTNLSCLIIHF